MNGKGLLHILYTRLIQQLSHRNKLYLPEGFNPLKGLGDLDWYKIELIELEDEVTIDFDTKQYLPKDFNPLKGLYDLDWSTIELIELEEEVTFNIDTK